MTSSQYAKGDKVFDSDGSLLVLVNHITGDEWSAYDPDAGFAVRIAEGQFTPAQSSGPAPF